MSLTPNGEWIRAELVERFVDQVAEAIDRRPDLADPRLPGLLDQASEVLREIAVDERFPVATPTE